ncbi:hypothetical protein [Rhodococcus sp. H29-C3]|uniref:hypothetical protein n=1 Tax=Rhodococcus sp. H29-C3 TaxID=3046307 RepID=UPI0024B959EB|nr:hypothetical protein [Rhodococcus sp. H29-C3]MDJ0362940.1 hypothetical protein [Rhodococcus sp. H29-C3]
MRRPAVSAALRSPGADSPCADQYGASFEDTITSRTYPAIRQALGDIERRAPRARVVVVGYQWLLPPTIGCAPQISSYRCTPTLMEKLQWPRKWRKR